MVFPNVCVLILGISDYVTLHAERDFAHVIKGPEMGRVCWVTQKGPM